MKHNIGISGIRVKSNSLLLALFFTACMVCTDSARLGKCLCPICVSGYCPGTFLFLPIGTICHRRLVHCAKHCRPASLPYLCAPHPQAEVEVHSACRRQVSSMGVRMVLSGMGIELLAKELLRTDTHPLYRVHSRKLPEVCRQLHQKSERFLHRHYIHQ